MNELKIFHNSEFGEIRTVQENGKVLFCGADVAKALGYAKPNNAISAHCKGTLKRGTLTKGGMQEMSFITEGDIYRLVTHSKLPNAEHFESWVFDEVLPTIRKTGAYSIVRKSDSYMIEDPAERARRWAEEYEEKRALEMKIEKDKPLVEFAEHIQVSDDCISMNDMAKLASKNGVKIGRNRLFSFLREQKVLERNNIPYQRYIENQPWFEVKESIYETASFKRICLTTMVTPKGQKGIIRMLKKEILNVCN